MVGGGVAGASGTLASAPGDVLRTRLVAQAEPVYKSIWHAVTQLWKEGGVPAFYKGALPAVMMTAPQAALQFAFYSLFTSLVPKVPLKDRSVSISIPESLSCGGLAGMASKSLLYPLDVAKKRLQVDTTLNKGQSQTSLRSLAGRWGERALARQPVTEAFVTAWST